MIRETNAASGWASALRVTRTSTPIFTTRNMLCRIVVRADREKPMVSKEKRIHFGDIWSSSEDSQTRIPSFGHTPLRFTED
jgi:hypothetical protein